MKKQLRNRLAESAGWYGVIAILLGYALVSFSAILPQSWAYQVLNASGAVGIILSSLHKKDYQPVALNVVWLMIAAVAIVNLVI